MYTYNFIKTFNLSTSHKVFILINKYLKQRYRAYQNILNFQVIYYVDTIK